MIVLEICGPFNVLDFQRNKHTSIPLVSRNLAYLTKCSLNIFKIKLTYESESEVSQSCPTLCNPWIVAYQAPPSMGFSRHEF